jgi:hypothetical protein
MGTYDDFASSDGAVVVQVKCGPCAMKRYTPGADVGGFYADGAIVGLEGCVVIAGGRVLSVTAELPEDVKAGRVPCRNKWGGEFNPTLETPETLAEDLGRVYKQWATESDRT